MNSEQQQLDEDRDEDRDEVRSALHVEDWSV